MKARAAAARLDQVFERTLVGALQRGLPPLGTPRRQEFEPLEAEALLQ